jgi:hypothetical protein
MASPAAARTLTGAKLASKLAAVAATGAIICLAVINNQRGEFDATTLPPAQNETTALVPARNETVVYRQMPAANSYVSENEEEPAARDADAAASPDEPRAVATVRFNANSVGDDDTRRAALTPTFIAKIAGFVAFPGKQFLASRDSARVDSSGSHQRRGAATMHEVDEYLWEVYQRTATKWDRSGDFTWKDPAAAKRLGKSLKDYVIGGMDPEFREQLYHAGRAMDQDGIQWAILSAFRDDYRQRLAKGFKARTGKSLHGGSRATGGYGHGRAVDLNNADGDADVVWQWIDANGAKYGLHRPIPGPDPAHVESRGEWRKLALALRESRLRASHVTIALDQDKAAGKTKVIKASLR